MIPYDRSYCLIITRTVNQYSGERLAVYDEILFPTDGSDGADVALDHAIELAETHDAGIHVLFVVDTTYLGSGAAESTTVESLWDRGEDVVEETADRVAGRDIEVTTEIRDGDPYNAIIDYADTERIDMIVMGTHGRRGLDRYLLGSVAEKVVRTAEAPVLTVRMSSDD